MTSLAPFLGRYDIQRELCHKAGRRTLLAQDIQSQELVIVKVIQFSPDFQWTDLKLFEREAKILQNLDHVAIPKYKDYFEADIEGVPSFVLVQTYIEADSLETIIQSGRRFSETEVREIAERLLKILSYLHQQMPPVVHRDIKPSNILISDRSGHSVGNIYLIDFGSVQAAFSKESGTITIVGSYGYIPLEQFTGQAVPASDLYSLGMTLVYLITGVHPADIEQVHGKVQLSREQVQPSLSRWLERLTHPYLDQRFDSATLALTALQAKDGGYGYYHHLKPEGSKVEIYRDHNQLKIVTGRPDDSPLAPLGCLFPAFIISSFAIAIGPVGLIIFVAVPTLIILWTIASCITQWTSLKNSTYHRDLLILDRQLGIRSGTCTSNPEQVRYVKQPPSKFQDANLLVYNPGYTFDHYYDGSFKKQSGTVKVAPALSLHAGRVEYLMGKNCLSQAEALWIGQELSDFLGLEMQTIYPTPKLPSDACGCGC